MTVGGATFTGAYIFGRVYATGGRVFLVSDIFSAWNIRVYLDARCPMAAGISKKSITKSPDCLLSTLSTYESLEIPAAHGL